MPLLLCTGRLAVDTAHRPRAGLSVCASVAALFFPLVLAPDIHRAALLVLAPHMHRAAPLVLTPHMRRAAPLVLTPHMLRAAPLVLTPHMLRAASQDTERGRGVGWVGGGWGWGKINCYLFDNSI